MNWRDVVCFFAICLALYSIQVNQNLISTINDLKEQNQIVKRNVEATAETTQVSSPAEQDQISTLEGVVQTLSQTLMKMQSTFEQRVRFEGNSGVTESRGYGAGTQAYHAQTHNTLNIHDHADTIDTLGMGEFSAILNGVEFTTRHNDYLLVQPTFEQPTPSDTKYHKTAPIPFPDVPPSVLAKATVAEQVAEMREYFRAFALQNASIRNYTQYFKANLCYLEGTWIKATANLEEPFRSDRHSIDAATWKILNEKYRFLMQNGQKNNLENLAWLPTAVRDLEEREDHDLELRGKTYPIFSNLKVPQPIAKWYTAANIAPAATRNLVVGLVKRVEGVYLSVYNTLGSDGTAVVNVTCNGLSKGCTYLTSVALCKGVTAGCTFRNQASSITFGWGASTISGFLFGPLTSCYNISVSFGATTNIDKILFFNIPTNYTINPTDNIMLTGCIYPATPIMANWEYRILCSPIAGDLPFNRFRVVEDNAGFVREGKNKTTMPLSRRALFELNPVNSNRFSDGKTTYEYIDRIMEAIPGKDNYAANLTDFSFGAITKHYTENRILNVGYYSRFYSLDTTDAMGRQQRRRGFNDPTLWAARTTQPKVAGLSVYDDINEELIDQKWTYAFPIEIVYTSPLSNWNPYNLRTWPKSATEANISTVTANGRFGGFNVTTCYNGTSHKHYFRTPAEFFTGAAGEVDPADTSAGVAKGVCDDDGNVRIVFQSGHNIFFPSIAGLPPIRQRWPLFPLHNTKTLSYKEAKAFETQACPK